MTKKLLILAIFLFALGLSSCQARNSVEQPQRTSYILLNQNSDIGQTFLSRYDGLNTISVYLNPSPEVDGQIKLSVIPELTSQSPIRQVPLSINGQQKSGYVKFIFQPIKSSSKQGYAFVLNYTGSGNIKVGLGPEKAYLNGSAYLDGQPQNSQLAFRLGYDSTIALKGLLTEFFTLITLLCGALALFTVPGWGIFAWLLPSWRVLNWIEKGCLSVGLSLSLYPLLLLWTDLIGMHVGIAYVWIPIMAGAILIITRQIFIRRTFQGNLDNQDNSYPNEESVFPTLSIAKPLEVDKLADLTFVIIAGLIVLTRFWPVRLLDAPLWGDSYQHTLITKLLLKNNGLFDSWQPYAELTSFTYHFGFHTISALLGWLLKTPVTEAVLWAGQILNILAVLMLYPIASRLSRSRWAGVVVVLVAGLLAPMPMFYANWGRYTQLAGQVILPILIFMIWVDLETKDRDWKQLALIWLMFVGLALTHYRVMIFALCFYPVFFLFNFRMLGGWRIIKQSFLQGVGALLLFLPWLLNTLKGKLPDFLNSSLSASLIQTTATQVTNIIGPLSNYLPIPIWILAGFATLAGFFRRSKATLVIFFWWILILILANPDRLHLPGASVIGNFAVFIAAYIPVSLLIGIEAGHLFTLLKEKISQASFDFHIGKRSINPSHILSLSALVIIMGLAIAGSILRIRDIKPSQFSLVTRPDVIATEWIDTHLPQGAKFLVNSFLAYGGSIAVGSDAGWWLPLLANRQTTQPPINYVEEDTPYPGYVADINQLVAQVQDPGLKDLQVLTELKDRQITHIYIGQLGGKVNTDSSLLNPEELIDNPHFKLVYHRDQVWIFEINY